MNPRFETVSEALSWLRDWLVDQSFPVWATSGVDFAAGGFFEKLSDDRRPLHDPRRTRVVGRQIFCFARSAELGWKGDSSRLVDHGLDFLLRKSLTPEGLVFSSVSPEGAPIRPDFDLYDHAFALFGLAEAAKVKPDRLPLLVTAGRQLRDRMVAGWKHPEIGFEEANPRRLPLLANPHMHLLEAFLSWKEIDPADRGWSMLADEVGALAMTRLIDPRIGCLREYFDGDWRPYPDPRGRVIEPGHQFEWAWLLCRWAPENEMVLTAARRLCHIGENFGIDPEHDVAIGELLDDMTPTCKATRIWAQCERVKAHIAIAELSLNLEERAMAERRIVRAVRGLAPFLLANTPGLYRDRMDDNGAFIPEHAPASSLYHVVFAACELKRYVLS